METIKLDKEDKMMILKALKQGYFDTEQFKTLAIKLGFVQSIKMNIVY